MTGLWRDLGFKIRLRYVRRVQTLSQATLDTLTRARFDLPLISDDPIVDQNVQEAVDEFLRGNHADEALSEQPDRFLQWLKSDEESRNILRHYLTTQNWIMEWIHRGAVPADALKYARAYQSTFDQRVPSSNLKAIRSFCKRLRAAHNKAERSLSESKAGRIDVSTLLRQPSTVAWVAFLTPTAIAVYGYLYSWVYFGHFGIDTAMFFSASDYIAYSINRVNFIAVALALSVVSTLYAIRDAATVSKVAKRLQSRRYLRQLRVIVVIISLTLLVQFWISPPMFFLGLAFLTAISALGHRFWYSVIGPHLKSGLFVGWLVGTLLTCGLVVWFFAKARAHAIDEHTPTPFLVETTGRTYSDANYTVVGATSGFVFLVDDGGDVEVVPSRTVTRIMISNRSDGIVSRLRHWGLERLRRAAAPEEASSRDGDP